MHWFDLRVLHNNSLIVSLLILGFAILAMFIPPIATELHEFVEFEGFIKQTVRRFKLFWNFKNLYQKTKFFLHKIFKLFQLSLFFSMVSNARLAVLNLLFFEVLNEKLFSYLSPNFHNSKYKQI